MLQGKHLHSSDPPSSELPREGKAQRSVCRCLTCSFMLQVLDTILHADRALFKQLGGLADAAVVVHLSSHLTVSSHCLTSSRVGGRGAQMLALPMTLSCR